MTWIQFFSLVTLLAVLAALPMITDEMSHDQRVEYLTDAADTDKLADPKMECCDQVDGKLVAKGHVCSIDCHYLMTSSEFNFHIGERLFEAGSPTAFHSFTPRIQVPPPRAV